MGRVIEGTCFWRRSRGHITRKHVGATARLIKWLPLISTMHMKGLCLLHDRLYASSPRDLPRYNRTEAGRKTMYHICSLILTLSTDVCVFPCVYAHTETHKHTRTRWNTDGTGTHQMDSSLILTCTVNHSLRHGELGNPGASFNYHDNLWWILYIIMI